MKEAICPIKMYGSCTGCPPIHVRIKKSAIRAQNRSCDRGRRLIDCRFDVCSAGRSNSTRMDANMARTPVSLFGIDRRIV